MEINLLKKPELREVRIGDIILAKPKITEKREYYSAYMVIAESQDTNEVKIISVDSTFTVAIYPNLESLREDIRERGEYLNMHTGYLKVIDVVSHSEIELRRM